MLNDTTKHRAFPAHAKPKSSRKLTGWKGKSRFTEFLIDTNIFPLVLIGKGVKSFGWPAVAAFIFGALSVYGYAIVVGPLPFALTDHPKTVRLSGVVRNANSTPVTDRFWVGALANQLVGPIQSPDGSFVLDVPASDSYTLAAGTNLESLGFYSGMLVLKDDKGLRLQSSLPLPMPTPASAAEMPATPSAPTKPKTDLARTFDRQ